MLSNSIAYKNAQDLSDAISQAQKNHNHFRINKEKQVVEIQRSVFKTPWSTVARNAQAEEQKEALIFLAQLRLGEDTKGLATPNGAAAEKPPGLASPKIVPAPAKTPKQVAAQAKLDHLFMVIDGRGIAKEGHGNLPQHFLDRIKPKLSEQEFATICAEVADNIRDIGGNHTFDWAKSLAIVETSLQTATLLGASPKLSKIALEFDPQRFGHLVEAAKVEPVRVLSDTDKKLSNIFYALDGNGFDPKLPERINIQFINRLAETRGGEEAVSQIRGTLADCITGMGSNPPPDLMAATLEMVLEHPALARVKKDYQQICLEQEVYGQPNEPVVSPKVVVPSAPRFEDILPVAPATSVYTEEIARLTKELTGLNIRPEIGVLQLHELLLMNMSLRTGLANFAAIEECLQPLAFAQTPPQVVLQALHEVLAVMQTRKKPDHQHSPEVALLANPRMDSTPPLIPEKAPLAKPLAPAVRVLQDNPQPQPQVRPVPAPRRKAPLQPSQPLSLGQPPSLGQPQSFDEFQIFLPPSLRHGLNQPDLNLRGQDQPQSLGQFQPALPLALKPVLGNLDLNPRGQVQPQVAFPVAPAPVVSPVVPAPALSPEQINEKIDAIGWRLVGKPISKMGYHMLRSAVFTLINPHFEPGQSPLLADWMIKELGTNPSQAKILTVLEKFLQRSEVVKALEGLEKATGAQAKAASAATPAAPGADEDNYLPPPIIMARPKLKVLASSILPPLNVTRALPAFLTVPARLARVYAGFSKEAFPTSSVGARKFERINAEIEKALVHRVPRQKFVQLQIDLRKALPAPGQEINAAFEEAYVEKLEDLYFKAFNHHVDLVQKVEVNSEFLRTGKKLGEGGFASVFEVTHETEELVYKQFKAGEWMFPEIELQNPNHAPSVAEPILPDSKLKLARGFEFAASYIKNPEKLNVNFPTHFHIRQTFENGTTKDFLLKIRGKEHRQWMKEQLRSNYFGKSTFTIIGTLQKRIAGINLYTDPDQRLDLDPGQVRKLASSTLETLTQLASAGFVHGDIKQENAFFTMKDGLRLIDTGGMVKLSKQPARKDETQYKGTRGATNSHSLPSLIMRHANFEQDFYSCGVMLLQCTLKASKKVADQEFHHALFTYIADITTAAYATRDPKKVGGVVANANHMIKEFISNNFRNPTAEQQVAIQLIHFGLDRPDATKAEALRFLGDLQAGLTRAPLVVEAQPAAVVNRA